MNLRTALTSARRAAFFPLCAAMLCSASAASAEDSFGIVIAPRLAPGATQEVAFQDEEQDGLPTIVPRSPAAAAAADGEAPKVDASRYAAVFRSIPFSRAEFDANPSYRDEATLEILTGNPRPQKIMVNQPAPPPPPIDYYPLNLPVMRHYFDMSRGPYSRYQHLFGYEGGYRLQYFRN